MEGRASGVKPFTSQHCKKFHNLCGIHFIASLNGHGGRGLVSEDEVVSQIFKRPLIVEAHDLFPAHPKNI